MSVSHEIPQCPPLNLEEAKNALGPHIHCDQHCKAKDYLTDLVERLETFEQTSERMGWSERKTSPLRSTWNIWQS